MRSLRSATRSQCVTRPPCPHGAPPPRRAAPPSVPPSSSSERSPRRPLIPCQRSSVSISVAPRPSSPPCQCGGPGGPATCSDCRLSCTLAREGRATPFFFSSTCWPTGVLEEPAEARSRRGGSEGQGKVGRKGGSAGSGIKHTPNPPLSAPPLPSHSLPAAPPLPPPLPPLSPPAGCTASQFLYV